MANNTAKLTKSIIDKIPTPPEGKREDYFDAELKGFGIRVTSRSKRFFVLKRVRGRLSRVMLKPYGIITPEEARIEASKTISKLYDGIDVNAEKTKDKLRVITLGDTLKRYFDTKKSLKPRTVKTYDDLINLYLKDWLNKPIGEITKDMVSSRHRKISEENGEAAANNVMRTLRAIYNFANELYDDKLPQNPVKRLSNTGQWNKIVRRDTVITPKDLPLFFQSIQKLENPAIRDYLLLLLFTGARRTEMASLKWKDVDMNEKVFTLTVTKNGKPLVLPMSDFIFDIFQRRLALRENEYVFPGHGKTGHIVETRRQRDAIELYTLKVRNNLSDEQLQSALDTKPDKLLPGIIFSLHDLRRTFASAVSGSVVGGYELKRLLNHSLGNNDVTAGYIIHSLDTLRKIMQDATDHILTLCGQEHLNHYLTHK